MAERGTAWAERLTGRTSVLGGLTAAGLLAVIASAQPWWRAVGTGTASGVDSVPFSGADTTGGLSQALAVVVLAGTLLSLVLGRRGRRVLAVLLGGVGLGAALLGLGRRAPSADTVRTRFRQVSLVEQFALEATAWPVVYGLAGTAVVIAAVLLFIGAPRWPARGRRFERQSRPLDAASDPAEAWRALDAGLDPTVVKGDDPRLAGSDPDVRSEGADDTIGRSMGGQIDGATDERLPSEDR
jgi:uncharacterized membrane protein (TIGR02234 family)